MNKTELIDAVAQEAGLSKTDAAKATLVGFGTFKVAERAERQGRNPKTKEAITIPAARVPKFTAGKTLKDAVAATKKAGKKK